MGRPHQSDPGMRLFLLSLITTVAICRSAPVTGTEKSWIIDSTTSAPRRRPDQEVGSPSELAWQAWLLVDAQTGARSGLDSASLLRRITPKSVFIAPALSLPACADGYRADAMGRCVKNINIDNQAHFDFLLQRLNAMYAGSDEEDAGKNDDAPQPASGPLQVNIPLGISGSQKSENDEPAPEDDEEDPVTVHELANGTKTKEDESTFFRGDAQKGSVGPTVSDLVVPVAEFVEEANKTFPEVVDYEVPVHLKSLLNESQVTDAPTAMPLLLPSTTSTPKFAENGTSGRTESTVEKSTEMEITSIRIPPTPAASEESAGESSGPLRKPGSSTRLNDKDAASLEDDEILEHGEAGEIFSPSPGGTSNDGDEAPTSNVSSEASIRGDVIIETTLVDLNADNVTADVEDSEDLAELLEEEEALQPEPEVVFSPQDSRGTASSVKRAEEIRTRYPHPLYSESLLYDSRPRQGDRVPIDGQASFNRESILPPDRQPQNYFRPLNADGFRPSAGFRPQQDFVRFPESRPRIPSYVRFPSDEANSIQVQDYKGYPEEVVSASASIKSSVPIRQKQTYWWLPPGWRVDPQGQDVPLQQPQQQQSSQKQRPMLLRFWARMPLVRDPSLYEPVPQRTPNTPLHQFQPNRMDFHKETSRRSL